MGVAKELDQAKVSTYKEKTSKVEAVLLFHTAQEKEAILKFQFFKVNSSQLAPNKDKGEKRRKEKGQLACRGVQRDIHREFVSASSSHLKHYFVQLKLLQITQSSVGPRIGNF